MIPLRLVASAADERVELDATAPKHFDLAGGGDEYACPPRTTEGIDIAGDEEHRVRFRELVPRQIFVVPTRPQLPTDRRDRPLGGVVDVGEGPPLRRLHRLGVDLDTSRDELLARPLPQLVVAECGEEHRFGTETGELDRGRPSASADLLPIVDGVRDLAPRRHALDAAEPDPFDVSDDGDAHHLSLTDRAPTTLDTDVTSIPPFETFYTEHRGIVLGVLRKRLGAQRAEDAFQETFLRALAAYGRLRNAENLRGWVLTIAERVAIDAHRRARPTEELPEVPHEDGRPAYEDLGELTYGLPPTERAAVVLRYGYDLTYDQIAAALDSNPTAARQATSSGVRRLRTKGEL